jgi:signal transduction histidine kinase
MQKNPSKNLQDRLENLFSGIFDSPPQTGPLWPERLKQLGLMDARGPKGWVWEADSRGKYIWCSPEIEQLLGIRAEKLVGENIHDIGLTETSTKALEKALAGTEPILDLALDAEDPEGTPMKLVLNARARTNPEGEIAGFRGVWQVLELQREEPSPPEISPPQLEEVEPQILEDFEPLRIEGRTGFLVEEDEVVPTDIEVESMVEDIQIDGAILKVPIRTPDEILGVIEFDAGTDGKGWFPEDASLAEEISQQLALALQDARTHQLTTQALDEMREADRLKTQFLANMSHELRTPLNSIIGFSRVILKGIDGPINETQEKDLNAIYSAGQHLLGLINDMLDLSKIEAGKMELTFNEVDLIETINSVLSTAQGLLKDKPIELVVDLPETLPTILADSIRVRQILLNLLSNSAKFTERGEIGVSVREMTIDDADSIVVAVFDTGPGIHPSEQQKLFEPFSQVDASPTRKTGGTGLGLSITRHLVELHGGRIWVDSAPGEGSTFAFSLPLNPEHSPLEMD